MSNYAVRVRDADDIETKLALIAEGIDAVLARRKPGAPNVGVEISSQVSSDVSDVINYWKQRMNRPQARATTERRRVVKTRMDEGYDVATIKRAIDGCEGSDFHMARGEYKGGTQYCDLTLICRTGTKLEQFAAMPSRTGEAEKKRKFL